MFLPIVLLLFGLGDSGKIALIAFIVFFQLLITTRDSARGIGPGSHSTRFAPWVETAVAFLPARALARLSAGNIHVPTDRDGNRSSRALFRGIHRDEKRASGFTSSIPGAVRTTRPCSSGSSVFRVSACSSMSCSTSWSDGPASGKGCKRPLKRNNRQFCEDERMIDRRILQIWIQASRPSYFVATFIPLGIGWIMAAQEGPLRPVRFLHGLLSPAFWCIWGPICPTTISITCKGPTWATPSGGRGSSRRERSPSGPCWRAILLTYGVATVIGLYIVIGFDLWGIFPVALFSLFSSIFYVAPPIKYGYQGAGRVVREREHGSRDGRRRVLGNRRASGLGAVFRFDPGGDYGRGHHVLPEPARHENRHPGRKKDAGRQARPKEGRSSGLSSSGC